MESNNQAIELLNDLLEKNRDAEKGYLRAAEASDNQQLSAFFIQSADTRRGFSQALYDEIKALGGLPDDHSSVASNLHRAWINLRANVSSRPDRAIIEECARGEKLALQDYDKALGDESTTPSTHRLLAEHRRNIKSALQELEGLEVLL